MKRSQRGRTQTRAEKLGPPLGPGSGRDPDRRRDSPARGAPPSEEAGEEPDERRRSAEEKER